MLCACKLDLSGEVLEGRFSSVTLTSQGLEPSSFVSSRIILVNHALVLISTVYIVGICTEEGIYPGIYTRGYIDHYLLNSSIVLE